MNCELDRMDPRQATMVALPLLLFGILVAGITLFIWVAGGPAEIAAIATQPLWHGAAVSVSVVSMAALIYAAVAAIRGNLVAWTYSWIAALVTGLVVSLNLVLDDRAFGFSRSVDLSIVTLAVLSCLVVFCRVALEGWSHSALLSLAWCGTLGLGILFFGVAGGLVFTLGLLAGLFGLVEALIAYGFARMQDYRLRLLFLAAHAALNVGIVWVVEAGFRSSDPSRAMGQFWSLAALLTGLLAGGTLSGLLGQFVRSRWRLFRMGG